MGGGLVTIVRRTAPASRPKRDIFVMVLAGLSGVVGGLFWSGPLPALGFVSAVPVAGLLFPKGSSFVFFLSYYLTATRSIPAFYPIFYAGSNLLSGVPVWLAWGVCLALPWILARRLPEKWSAFRLPLGYLPSFFPPLWFIGAASPLLSAGALFPGTGIGGLLCLVVWQMGLLEGLGSRRKTLVALCLVFPVLATLSNAGYRNPPNPAGWTAIGTHDEPRRVLDRTRWEMKIARKVLSALYSGARTVLLPEGIGNFWTKDQAGLIVLPFPWSVLDREAREKGAVVLVGSEIPRDSRLRVWDDSLVVMGRGGIRAVPARQPIPVAGWNPISRTHHEPAHWRRTNVVEIEGRRAEISLCFEDLLVGAQVEAILPGNPTVILSADSLWFSKGTSDRPFQSVSIRVDGRLFGIPVLRAVNQ